MYLGKLFSVNSFHFNLKHDFKGHSLFTEIYEILNYVQTSSGRGNGGNEGNAWGGVYNCRIAIAKEEGKETPTEITL